MFGQTYYFGLLKKYVSLFGTLFNDIVIIRSSEGETDQIIKVPIEYAPRSKMISQLEANPDLDRPYSQLLPRMSFEHGALMYDGIRKLQTVVRVVAEIADNSDKLNYQYVPVPFNIPWNLYVYVKYNEDGAKIVEQILPQFTPDFTVTAELIEEMNEVKDIPVNISSPVSKEDRYTGDGKSVRMQVWTIPFMMQAYFYGPVKSTGIIKLANTSFYIANTVDITDSIGNTDIVERVIITPGLDANGEPVNYYGPYPANTTSIPSANITANDDFGYIETIESIESFGAFGNTSNN